MRKYRVLLVEDRNIPRLYFEHEIRNAERFTLVGTETNMEDAMKKARYMKFDLLLMEASQKDGTANFSALRKFRKENPKIRIVVVADVPEHSYLRRAAQCGADSFWYGEDTEESILSVMERTMDGEAVFPQERPSVKIGQMEGNQIPDKELMILREVVKGYSNREIAERLEIPYFTVRDYVKSLLEKTHLQSRMELAVKAVSIGLIVLENNMSKPVR